MNPREIQRAVILLALTAIAVLFIVVGWLDLFPPAVFPSDPQSTFHIYTKKCSCGAARGGEYDRIRDTWDGDH